MATRSNRIREPKVQRIAMRAGMPEAQARRDDLVVVDVKNANDDDLRHMKRSGQVKTVRRKTKLEKLFEAQALTLDGYRACRWYQDAYSLGYDTIGVTAQYENTGGVSSGNRAFTHLAKHIDQQQARQIYAFAREGMDSLSLALLDKVVLHGRPIGRLTLTFRLAVSRLTAQAERVGAI